MDVDFQALIDNDFIDLLEMMEHPLCVKTPLEVVATGTVHSLILDDFKIPAEIVLEKGKLFGLVAYTWFCRDADSDHYDSDSVWFLKKEDAIKHGKAWMDEDKSDSDDEESDNEDEIVLDIISTEWFNVDVISDDIKCILNFTALFDEKRVMKISKNTALYNVTSPSDYDDSKDYIFITFQKDTREGHARNILKAILEKENQ